LKNGNNVAVATAAGFTTVKRTETKKPVALHQSLKKIKKLRNSFLSLTVKRVKMSSHCLSLCPRFLPEILKDHYSIT
jgi:hypothetical protein